MVPIDVVFTSLLAYSVGMIVQVFFTISNNSISLLCNGPDLDSHFFGTVSDVVSF